MSETILVGGDVNVDAVVRVGDTVRRPLGPWSPAVHALLRHFEAVGFDGAPRFLGTDEQDREILTYVEGDAALAPAPDADEAVAGLGRLVRRMHDAQEGFDQGAVRWPEGEGPIVCFRDYFPPNVIFRDALPVALIDWEMARPGERADDVAVAAAWWVPLRPDKEAAEWGLPTDRRRERLLVLCDSYGLDDRADLVDRVLTQRRAGYETHRRLGGEQRVPGWREMWDNGSGERILGGIAWLEDNRGEIDEWLR